MEIAERLRSALAGRYEILEEIGSGATAIVFRASDLRHSRMVALKVLRPDVANAVGAERFLREIEISSKLTHPHILPLHDSGEAEGLLFFIMPLVEGESLRDRLSREGPLPVEDALRITDQVASALQYAHDRNILHRDVKPENIMLSRGEAFLADMGVARAVGEAGTDHLTSTGLAIGTPLYMSPEQAAGETRLDGRTDLYSLACVLFEMLSGQPPFMGPTTQAVLAKHALETIPSLRILRSVVSPGMEHIIHRALGKTPADRFPSVVAFSEALKKAHTDERYGVWATWWTRARPRRSTTGIIAATGVVALLVWLFTAGPFAPRPELDPDLLAVLPFTLDPALPTTFLSTSSIAEAVSVRFTGEGGPRAAASDTVIRLWEGAGGVDTEPLPRSATLRVAERVGAAFVLGGSFHPERESAVLDVWVLSVQDRREVARIDGLSWSTAALDPTLDQLTIELLVQLSGNSELRPDLSQRELTVVRSYLEGVRAYEDGYYARAQEYLTRTIETDTAFALGGLALLRAEDATGVIVSSGWLVALNHIDQLRPNDRDHLRAFLGPDSGPPRDLATQIWAWDLVTLDFPDDWLGAYFHGKNLLEWGGLTTNEAYLSRARHSLARSLDLRPRFVPALESLLTTAGLMGDSAEVVRIGGDLSSRSPPVDAADYVTWLPAATKKDTASLREVRTRFPEASSTILERIIASALFTGLGVEEAVVAGEEHRARSGSRVDLFYSSRFARALAIDLGRPLEAAGYETSEPFNVPRNNLLYIIEAAYWDGSRQRAEEEVAESRAMMARAGRHPYAYQMDRCSLGLWRLASGDSTGVQAAIDSLKAEGSPSNQTQYVAPICAGILEVERAVLTESPDLGRYTDSLDLLMRAGPPTYPHLIFAGNRAVARGFEALGDAGAALRAVRRRSFYPSEGIIGLSTLLREEARLAALTGDTTGAIRAYRHYLALRFDPEEELLAERDSIRQELRRLEAAVASAESG